MVQAEWMRNTSTLPKTPGSVGGILVELKRLQKGTIPVVFAWNGFQLPVPRHRVQLFDSEMETVTVAPDHDYCGAPDTGESECVD